MTACYVLSFSPKNQFAGVTELKVKGKKRNKTAPETWGTFKTKNGIVNMANIDYHYRPTDDSRSFFKTDIVILSGKQDRSCQINYKGLQFDRSLDINLPHIQLSDENLIAVEIAQ